MKDFILERIRGASNFEVNMGAGRFSGSTDESDSVALIDRLALSHKNLACMGVEGLGAVRMRDNDV